MHGPARLRKLPLPTADQVRSWFHYNSLAGTLHERSRHPDGAIGPALGMRTAHGYLALRIYGGLYPLHRLIWLYVHGTWPTDQIDHINRNRADNRIENLRQANPAQNKANTPAQRNNNHGAKGVTWCAKDQRWHARIQISGKRKFLGGFKTHQEAKEAYVRAATEAHGSFATSLAKDE